MASFVTADLHLSANRRDAYRHEWMEKLPDLLDKEKADRLIVLGDVTAEKDYHGAWLTNKIAGYMTTCAEVCPVYVLQGNHDCLTPTNPFFEFLGRYKRIKWIKDITALSLVGLGKRCLFIPHQRKLDLWNDMKELKEEWDWVFTHATFKGARNEQGLELDGSPTGALLGHRVVSGDVHVPQKLGPLTYVGPPYVINFGDKYLPRVLLLDEHGMNQRLCEGPRKLLLEIEGVEEWDIRSHPGDIVKVRYSIKSSEFDQWPARRKKIEAWAQRRQLKVDSILPVPLLEDDDSKANKRVVKDASDDDYIQAVCKRYRVGEKTAELGRKIIQHVGKQA